MVKYLQKHDKILYSNHWSTPSEIYNFYINNGYVDPCPLYSEFDFKDINSPMFINPPYERGKIDLFIDYAINMNLKYNNEIVLLIPARTDTKYFHKLLNHGIEIEFIKGRLKFGNAKTGAPFPSVLIYLREVKK